LIFRSSIWASLVFLVINCRYNLLVLKWAHLLRPENVLDNVVAVLLRGEGGLEDVRSDYEDDDPGVMPHIWTLNCAQTIVWWALEPGFQDAAIFWIELFTFFETSDYSTMTLLGHTPPPCPVPIPDAHDDLFNDSASVLSQNATADPHLAEPESDHSIGFRDIPEQPEPTQVSGAPTEITRFTLLPSTQRHQLEEEIRSEHRKATNSYRFQRPPVHIRQLPHHRVWEQIWSRENRAQTKIVVPTQFLLNLHCSWPTRSNPKQPSSSPTSKERHMKSKRACYSAQYQLLNLAQGTTELRRLISRLD
jgi:hypothetical protein